MSEKSIVQEARDIQLAMELITLGARLQMLKAKRSLAVAVLLNCIKSYVVAHRRKACCRFRPTGL